MSAVWISFGLLSLGRSLTVASKYSSLSLMLVGWWVGWLVGMVGGVGGWCWWVGWLVGWLVG